MLAPVPLTLWTIVAAAIGSGLGGALRLVISATAAYWTAGRFPLGTLLVNVGGCLAMGMLTGAFAIHWTAAPPWLRVGLLTGVLGGLTTFSAFGIETVTLAQQERIAAALINAVVNVALSLLAAWSGLRLVQALA